MATYDKEINYAESKTYFKLKERHIYGSFRVGVRNSDLDVLPLPDKNFNMTTVHYSIGSRTYELSNHLGNVLSVISDTAEGSHEVNVIPVFPYSNVISEMRADIRVAQDYSPFGVTLDGRNFVVSEGYRYSFQGQERDDEIKGAGNSVNYAFRMHDPRVGRFFAIDPLSKKYPHYTPYSFSGNKVIHCVELEGLEDIYYRKKVGTSGKLNWIGTQRNDNLIFNVNRTDVLYDNNTLNYIEIKTLDGTSIIKYGKESHINAEQINSLISEVYAEKLFESMSGTPIFDETVKELGWDKENFLSKVSFDMGGTRTTKTGEIKLMPNQSSLVTQQGLMHELTNVVKIQALKSVIKNWNSGAYSGNSLEAARDIVRGEIPGLVNQTLYAIQTGQETDQSKIDMYNKLGEEGFVKFETKFYNANLDRIPNENGQSAVMTYKTRLENGDFNE